MINEIIISNNLDLERKAWLILQHIHIFYFCKINGKISNDTFPDFNKIEELLHIFFELQYNSDVEFFLKYKITIEAIQLKVGLKNFKLLLDQPE